MKVTQGRPLNLQIQGTTGVGGSFLQLHQEPDRSPIGRRIRFLEPPAVTQYWIKNERRIFGRASWHPRYGMTGTIIELPAPGAVGTGPRVRWDDGHTSWLGSSCSIEYLD